MIANTLTEDNPPGRSTVIAQPRSVGVKVLLIAITTVLLAGTAVAVRAATASKHSDNPNRAVPVNTGMQQRLGVRFTRAAVVADGGLITLSYVVLDSDKATLFQSDRAHPPTLTSESRPLSTAKVSLMKQGHVLNAGQTYYLVYENTRGALRPGEQVTITDGGLSLPHFPVL